MRYKLIGLALILLLATPAYGQRISPVIVETPKITKPTTVITGQPFLQVYVVKFFDSSDEYKEIKIQEDQLTSITRLGSFDVLSVDIVKEPKRSEYSENIWYLSYTLRIINEKKSADLATEKREPYKVPRITIPWTGRKIGDESANLTTNTDVRTDEVYVNYVSTITLDPSLFIRDHVDFGDFSRQAFWSKVVFWSLVVTSPLFLILAVAVSRRRLQERTSEDTKEMSIELEKPISNIKYTVRASRKQALRSFNKSVKRLTDFGNESRPDNAVEVMSDLNSSIMSVLRAEVPGSKVGTTPREMPSLIDRMTPNSRRSALVKLAQKVSIYSHYLEIGTVDKNWHVNPIEEAEELKNILRTLRRHWILDRVRMVFRR